MPFTHLATLLLCSVAGCAQTTLPTAAQGQATATAPAVSAQAPEVLFDVVKVVDGDTIHILREGKTEKLRLLSVDTEEKISGGYRGSPTKPPTVYGEESAHWAQDFFAALAEEGAPSRVGLRFPGGKEARDVYGRLLCHVILPDGTDFNLLLVKEGRSPYFNKYGNSRICHEEFVAAQAEARAQKLGVWNPKTNQPERPGAPAAKRPYDRLLPWWEARARAIDDFRRRQTADPRSVANAEEPAELLAAVGREVDVFGTLFRVTERDGGLLVEFRTSQPDQALNIEVPAAQKEAYEAVDLAGLQEEFRQNYAYVRGVVRRRTDGTFGLETTAKGWRRAGPEPTELTED